MNLFDYQDKEYKQFHQKIVPNIDSDTIIGIRCPVLKKLAKEVESKETFMDLLPHNYYEENMIHAYILNSINSYETCIQSLNQFLPYVDNWAVCDAIRPSIFSKHKEELLIEIKKWITSNHEYTIRFGIEMLMKFYLDESFDSNQHEMILNIQYDTYYVNMMKAWYFCEALIKQWDSTIFVLENNLLDTFTHNKTIQKCIDSCRIDTKNKAYLKTLRKKDKDVK
ncbi:MAG: DNA alkylation repair protein [Erysipelotrichaceae bacterium]|uniref:DNA alkylation repair protein n=1 Tax=Floccifex sp. TaxID=2815810 RepID=UPI002A74C669|nr:DNA alkylation repair protein [Floccifex sp.]MDD7281518.1 DNA alkylation repair protein [Erysipelotrichaceae bacterium]MDY2957979.1 DNA alkylation repair protein [Floccifex sp.]